MTSDIQPEPDLKPDVPDSADSKITPEVSPVTPPVVQSRSGWKTYAGVALGVAAIGAITFATVQVIAPNSDSSGNTSSSSSPASISSSTVSSSPAFSNSSSSSANNSVVDPLESRKMVYVYDPGTEEFSYQGEAVGNNGCAEIESHDAKLVGNKIEVTVKIKYVGQICTQALVGLPFSGKAKLQLTAAQAQRVSQMVQVTIVQQSTRPTVGR